MAKINTTDKKKEPNNLSTKVYDEIRKTIFLSDYMPGRKLEYRKIAEDMNMSPTPVVQALKHMELLGLVHHEPKRGFQIKEITYEEVKEAHELRGILELSLIPKIIDNLNDISELKLKKALTEYQRVSEKGHIKLRLAKDLKFHLTIAEISDKPLTLWILRYLYDFLWLNRLSPGLFYYRPHNAATNEHEEIFDRLMARDAQGAGQAMSRHIRNVCHDTLESIKAQAEAMEQIDF